MNLQIPNRSLQQKQYRLHVSQFCFFKNHISSLIFAFDTLCWSSPACHPAPSPSQGLRAPCGGARGDTHSYTAARWGGPGSVPQDHGGPAFVPPYRGVPRLPQRYLCTGRRTLDPHLTKSPECHVAGQKDGEEVCERGSCRAHQELPPMVGAAWKESGEPAAEWAPPTLALCTADYPLPHTTIPPMCPCCFHLTMAEGGGGPGPWNLRNEGIRDLRKGGATLGTSS